MAPGGWKQHRAEGAASVPLPFVMSPDNNCQRNLCLSNNKKKTLNKYLRKTVYHGIGEIQVVVLDVLAHIFSLELVGSFGHIISDATARLLLVVSVFTVNAPSRRLMRFTAGASRSHLSAPTARAQSYSH